MTAYIGRLGHCGEFPPQQRTVVYDSYNKLKELTSVFNLGLYMKGSHLPDFPYEPFDSDLAEWIGFGELLIFLQVSILVRGESCLL